jgi:hypothetical protein
MAITDEQGVTYTASTDILQAYLNRKFDRTQYLRLLTRFYQSAGFTQEGTEDAVQRMDVYGTQVLASQQAATVGTQPVDNIGPGPTPERRFYTQPVRSDMPGATMELGPGPTPERTAMPGTTIPLGPGTTPGSAGAVYERTGIGPGGQDLYPEHLGPGSTAGETPLETLIRRGRQLAGIGPGGQDLAGGEAALGPGSTAGETPLEMLIDQGEKEFFRSRAQEKLGSYREGRGQLFREALYGSPEYGQVSPVARDILFNQFNPLSAQYVLGRAGQAEDPRQGGFAAYLGSQPGRFSQGGWAQALEATRGLFDPGADLTGYQQDMRSELQKEDVARNIIVQSMMEGASPISKKWMEGRVNRQLSAMRGQDPSTPLFQQYINSGFSL